MITTMQHGAIDGSEAGAWGRDDPAAAPDDGPPMSIGLLSAGWPPDAHSNGVVTYVAAMAAGLEAMGHRVTILSERVAPDDRDERVYRIDGDRDERSLLRRAADRLWRRAAPRSWKERRAGREFAAAIARGVAERGIEVLEMEEAFGWAEEVRRAIRVPVSVRLHGPWFLNGAAIGEGATPAYRVRVAREGVAIGRARGVTAPSLDVLERTRAHYGLALEHAEVIPNPTRPVPPADRWRTESAEPATILFVGRFDRHKGGDLIVEAFARVLREVPGARLWFAGPDRGLLDDSGRRWDDVASFIDDRLPGARVDGRVRLLGAVPHSHLPAIRRRAAITVVCSRYEVFGLTAAEAAAMGCPIVAARTGGLPEVIRDGVEGLLHRPGDPDDLASRIVALLADPRRAAELGRRAAERCDREFQPIAIAARLAAHLRGLRRRAAAGAG